MLLVEIFWVRLFLRIFNVPVYKLNPNDAESGNQIQATLVGGKCSHHYAATAF